MEMCLGQFSSTGCLTLFRIAPLLKGTGYAIILVNIICTIYYNVIIAYPLVFIVKSMAKELPWMHCNHEWNTVHCLELRHSRNDTAINANLIQNLTIIPMTGSIYKTPADEFFK